ncbi:Crp/Fnr family transcriptional regulator [Christiangramia fulva]|uniref:Crp/Fnr family transcriptional regulator n=1 Tax=Christiangramia fulva TaxID=2126553 RepID=A0A2R3Z3S4_9FLAO|nr:ThuA domain-containing protein [Christiangramia fulva]AVR44909.1 Crp/Fnr family transcriptional regulator [Christiangramia fulva]
MKYFLFFFLALCSGFFVSAQQQVLVFHETQGWHHKSIPDGVKAIKELGQNNDFQVTDSDDSQIFLSEDLSNYDLIIFLNTTGDVFNEKEQLAFRNYIENGGNYLGIHSASDTEYDWPFYGKLVGAYFKSHPAITSAKIKVKDPSNEMVSHLPPVWERTDEWYNFNDIQDDINVLLELEESTYEGGENGDFHPIAWYKATGNGGVSIYTAGGHTSESYTEPLFREHLLRSIQFALEKGNNSIKQ